MQGRAQIAPLVWHHPSLQGWDDTWFDRFDDLYWYDPVRARELLEEADAVGFKLTIHNYPYGGFPELNQINEALAQYFIDIGVDATLNDTEYGIIRPDLRSSRFWGQLAGFPYVRELRAPYGIIRSDAPQHSQFCGIRERISSTRSLKRSTQTVDPC